MADITALFADNTAGLITPEVIRTFLSNSVDSTLVPSTDGFSGRVYVDKVFGNDSTGERQNVAKPFSTIQAAITAAQFGDTVYPYHGIYAENLTFKDGVHVDGDSMFLSVVNGNATLTSYNGFITNIKINGNVTITGGVPNFLNCELDPAGHQVSLRNFAQVIAISCTVNGTLVDFDTACRITARNCTLASLNFSHGSTLYTDAASLPISLSITNGSVLTLTDKATGVNFSGYNATNWNTAPASVSEALEELAARVKALEPV